MTDAGFGASVRVKDGRDAVDSLQGSIHDIL